MVLYILFGLPGAGKTFAGEIFKKEFGFYLYDGDIDMPLDLRQAIIAGQMVTDNMRNRFFGRLIKKISLLTKNHNKLVVTQTFIKEKYRRQLLKNVPHARFILIESNIKIRERRLIKRKYFPSNLGYARKMNNLFDAPKIDHLIITNNKEGAEQIKRQIRTLKKVSS